MTDKQRLAKLLAAEKYFKQTKKGYEPSAPNWRKGMQLLDAVQEDLREPPPPKIPNLGPFWQGGKSVLLHQLTHATSGVPGYPAADDGWAAGLVVIAPEAVEITRASSSNPGDACFMEGASGLLYWVGHLVVAPAVGKKFVKGAQFGRIFDQGRLKSHVHWGIDARPLIGKSLKYGKNGNGPNYTYGSASVGVQLKAAL